MPEGGGGPGVSNDWCITKRRDNQNYYKMIITYRKILGSFTNSPGNNEIEMKDRKIKCGQRINLNFHIYKPAFNAIVVLVNKQLYAVHKYQTTHS